MYQVFYPRECYYLFYHYYIETCDNRITSIGNNIMQEYQLNIEDVHFCDQMLFKTARSLKVAISFLPNTPEFPLRLAVGIYYLIMKSLDTMEYEMDLTKFGTLEKKIQHVSNYFNYFSQMKFSQTI